MEKNIKDYIAYYIGCRCLNTWFPEGHEKYDSEWQLTGVRPTYPKPYLIENGFEETWTDSIKPILRRLYDITEEEKKYIGLELKAGTSNVECLNWQHVSPFTSIHLEPKVFHYLLKQGFDLFQLIENDLAVDEKTLTK